MQSDLIFPLLGAVFGNLGGEVQFSSENNHITTRDADEIEAFLAANEQVHVSLVTSTGEVAGRAFAFDSEDEAHEFALEIGKPTIAFDYDGESRLLFYADIDNEPFDCEVDHIPLPGKRWSIYEGSLEYVIGEPEKLAEQPVEEPAPEPAEKAEPASDGPQKLNDAIIVGQPSEVALALPLKLGFGKGRQDKKWPAKQMTYHQLIVGLSNHVVGEKDGTAFIQGTAIGNERRVPAIDALYVMGLDVDSGIDPMQVVNKVQDLGLTSIVYTTNSHMKTETFLVENSFIQFCNKRHYDTEPTPERVREFLVEERHWEQWVADTVEIGEVTQTAEGKGYILSHDPMPKFRIVFPLNEPFVIAKFHGSQNDAIKMWKSKLIGLAKTLELPIDESCLDPSRLFYLPRHSKNAKFGIWITGGDALDFMAIPEGKVRGRDQNQSVVSNDVFAQAGADLAAKGDSALVIDGNFSLKRWAREVAHDFDVATMVRTVAPNLIRNDQNTSKVTIACPFDHYHGNAGDPDDQGCYVQSPSPETGLNSFVFQCSHNSCKGRDRLEFVAEAVSQGWFTRADLSNNDFRLMSVEDQDEFFDIPKMIDEAVDAVKSAGKDPRNLQKVINEQVEILMNAQATTGDLNMFLESVKATKACTSAFAKESFATAKRRAQAKQTPEQKKEQEAKRTFGLNTNGCTAFILGPEKGYVEQRASIIETLTALNKTDTRIFTYGNVKFSVEQMLEHNDVAVSALTKEHLADKLSKPGGLIFFRSSEDKPMSIPIPDRILNEMLVNEDWLCPQLNGFSELPYFNKNAKLVQKVGYDPASLTYLKPSNMVTKDGFDLKVSDNPTMEEVRAARDLLLDETFGDFPFDDGPEEEHQAAKGAGSRSHFLALLIQPFIREMIQGPTPIYLVSKPTAGTGASLLLACSMFITSGKPSKTATHKYSEEEQRKEITSAFVAAKTYFLIDNIRHEINSAAYCNLATSTVWEDRLLGASKMASYPNRMQFIIAGNNPRGTYEIMRRCLPIRLDAKIDPRKRDESKFRHPRLEEWVHAHQKELVEAILTIIQGWIKAGKPRFEGKPLMSFESWSEITGGILEFAGVEGFLTNLHLSQKYANDETTAFETFYSILAEVLDGLNKPFTMRQIADYFVSGDAEFPQIGARYNDQPNQLAVNLDRVLKEKIGAPFDIMTNDGRHITVKLSRVQPKEGQKAVMFQLVPM